jgi:hydroxyacylglutathione hydrolase
MYPPRERERQCQVDGSSSRRRRQSSGSTEPRRGEGEHERERRFATVAKTSALLLCALGFACSSEDNPAGSTQGSTSAASGSGATGATTGSTGTGGAGSTGTGGTTGVGGGGGGVGGTPDNGFPDLWDNGLSCGSAPDVQVWEYDADTFILRQTLCSNFEGPFWYLFFGSDRALLQDTGTGDVNGASVVSTIIADWLASKGKTSIELVVTHSHGHGDHVGGDSQYAGLPNTTVVGTSPAAVQAFFGIDGWPGEIVQYDLGGRVLDIIPIPGHQSAHIAVYDRREALLLTGDTLYPGRLYIDNWSAYQASVGRMVGFVDAGNPVKWVLGTHIEMNQAGQDYDFGEDQHPNEHVLELEVGVLKELNQAVIAMGNSPTYEAHPHFIIYP